MAGISAGTAFVDVLPNMAKFNTALQSGMAGVATKTKAAGAKLTRNLTLPIVAAGAASVKLAKDFEGTFAQMEGLAGVAASEVAGLKDAVLELGPAVGKGPRELARALYFIRSSGVSGQRALDALTESAKLSAAGLGETETVADAITSAINAYGQANLSSATAADILAAAVREGKGEADAMAPALGNVLPLAAELGVGFDDVAGSIAAMTRIGMNVPTATTSLQAFFSSLLKLTPKAEENLEKVGLSADGLRKTLAERGLLTTLDTLREAFDGNVEAMANSFPNIRALRGLLALTGKNADGTREVLDAMAKSTGAAGDAFGAVARDEGFKFQQTLAKAETAGIRLGTALLPVATRVADAVGNLADRFNGLSDSQQKIALFALGVTALLGPLLTLIGNLATAIGGIAKAGAFLAANPWLVGLGLLAGALVLLSTKTDIFKSDLDETKGAFDRARAAAELYKGALDRLKTTSDELIDADLGLAAATLAHQRAKKNSRAAIKEYGKDSLEAKEALLAQKQAHREVQKAIERQDKAQRDSDTARRDHLMGLRATRGRLEDLRKEYASIVPEMAKVNKGGKGVAVTQAQLLKTQALEKFKGQVQTLITEMGGAQTSAGRAALAVLNFTKQTGRIPTEKEMKVIADTANATEKIKDFQEVATRPLETTLDVNIRTHGSIRAPTGLDARAGGGPVMAGRPYLVGEEGVEVSVPRTNRRIIPNHLLGAARTGSRSYAILDLDRALVTVHDIAEEADDSHAAYLRQRARMSR